MKAIFLFLAIALSINSAFAQGSAGLVAHWPFNGNANDISGNNLNGVVSGASLVNGYNLSTNNAYLFKGYNINQAEYEHIDVPYDAKMNVQHFSICTLVKVDSFWPGLCTVSALLWRGTQGTADYYSLSLNDNVNDDDCYAFSPTVTNYVGEVGDLAWGVAWHDRGYPNYAIPNTWTCVVETFDGDSMKIYMDGVLRNSVYYPYSLLSGSENLRIGASTFNISASGTHPYPFLGAIDDMKLYDRALTLLEVDMYCEEAKRTNGDGGGNGGGTDWPTSVNSVSNDMAFVLAPNPATNHVQALFNNNTNGKVQLLNSLGQVIAEQIINGNSVQFDLDAYVPGVYMIRVQTNGQTVVKKFLKQ